MQAGEGQLHIRLDPPPGRRWYPAPTRSGIPAGPSCRSRPRRAAPATGSHRAGSPRPGHPVTRIPSPDLAGAPQVRGNGPPPSSEISSLPAGDNHDGVLDRPRGREVLACRLITLLLGARAHVDERRVVRMNAASAGGDRRHGPATERRLTGCAHAQLSSRDILFRTRRHYASSRPRGSPSGCRRRAGSALHGHGTARRLPDHLDLVRAGGRARRTSGSAPRDELQADVRGGGPLSRHRPIPGTLRRRVTSPGHDPRRTCETTRRSRVVLISNRTPKRSRP